MPDTIVLFQDPNVFAPRIIPVVGIKLSAILFL